MQRRLQSSMVSEKPYLFDGAFFFAKSPRRSKRRYTPPFSLRLTIDERKRLDEMAGNQPLGFFIRNRLFNEHG